MKPGERTRDIYESVGRYPQPPLIPLPVPGDIETLERVGLRLTRVSRWIVRSAMNATGFTTFHHALPGQIEHLMRTTDQRGGYLFAPVVAATLALADDARGLSAIERAATLILAVRGLYRDVITGALEPDRYHGQALEMGQYPNLFATCLVVDGKQARIFKSTNVSRIIVAVARRFYALEIGPIGDEPSAAQLATGLAEIAEAARYERVPADEPAPGLLTCAGHAFQLKVFNRLQRDATNARSLELLRHSLLTICLDLDSAPGCAASAALAAHSGNCSNRWYHSSFQLVVFGNARAAAICNFSTYLDGNTMMRAAAEIQRRAAACPIDPFVPAAVRLPPVEPLHWRIEPRTVYQARNDLNAVLDNQQATFEIEFPGKAFLTAHGFAPVPMFIVALQLAAQRLTSRTLHITQFLTMARYRCADLTTADVTTPEMVHCIDYLAQPQVEPARARTLLHAAITSQAQACRKARSVLPVDEIFPMFTRSLTRVRRLYVTAVATTAVILLRLIGAWKPMQRDIVVSHPEIYPEVPVVGRPGVRLPYVTSFGLHYQILDDRVVITIMPGVHWSAPNVELIAELRASLSQIRRILEQG